MIWALDHTNTFRKLGHVSVAARSVITCGNPVSCDKLRVDGTAGKLFRQVMVAKLVSSMAINIRLVAKLLNTFARDEFECACRYQDATNLEVKIFEKKY